MGSAAWADVKRRRWPIVAAVSLWFIGIGLAIAASVFHAHDSPALTRLWSDLPGVADVCGDVTWFGRAIPPGLALMGTLLTLRARDRRARIATVLGALVVAGLAFAVTQNAVPWGERLCVVD